MKPGNLAREAGHAAVLGLGAAAGAVIVGAFAGAVLLSEITERHARRAMGMARAHPERISGSDRAARTPEFRRLAEEIGIDAGEIIDAFRRGL
jgi:hypothetical protein